MVEAGTNTQTGLNNMGETDETLTQNVGDVEELAELTLHPDDVSEIFMSAEESDLCFKEPDDHLGRTR